MLWIQKKLKQKEQIFIKYKGDKSSALTPDILPDLI